MKLFGSFVLAFIVALFIIYFFIYPDALRAAYNKCDQVCKHQRQYCNLKFNIDIPPWSYNCGGHRMPDNYLIRK